MAQEYFSNLNYTMANEDTSLEVEMVSKLKPKRILSVLGSGGRALPLLSSSPEELVCVDVSKDQINLGKLRLETMKSLSLEDFLIFWGYPPYEDLNYSSRRKEIFETLALESEVRLYFKDYLRERNFQSILYEGKWEKTFQTLAKAVRLIMGKNFDQIFYCQNMNEQKGFYLNHFSLTKWRVVLFLLGNKSVFNALLYRGDFVKKSVPESYYNYYFDSFDRLFTKTFARENFFLQLCFFGRIVWKEAVTIEGDPDCFQQVKSALVQNRSKVTFENGDFFQVAKRHQNKGFDFVSLSDVPSYFNGDLEEQFLNKLAPSLNDDAVVVIRYYLKIANVDVSKYEDITNRYEELIEKEKVGVYRIKVYRYKGQST